jgi:DNA-binding transcriptional ArsR family regulator
VTARSLNSNDEVWLAVADPSRLSILELLINGGEATASALANDVPFTRQAVAKHLAVLERAQLVSSRRQGREVLFSVRPTQIDNAAQMMINLGRAWDVRLQSIKRIAEDVHRTALASHDYGQSAAPEESSST